MKIGLIDVDGHHFPNLALMRISAWHKVQGDDVEWWWSDLTHYDIVYMSKIFRGSNGRDITLDDTCHRAIQWTIEDAPTIIPADKEEEG